MTPKDPQDYFKEKVTSFLRKNNIKGAIGFISDSLDKAGPNFKTFSNSIVIFSSRNHEIRLKKRLGLETPDILRVQKSRLIEDLLEFVNEFESEDFLQDLQQKEELTVFKTNLKVSIFSVGLIIFFGGIIFTFLWLQNVVKEEPLSFDDEGSKVLPDRDRGDENIINDIEITARVFTLSRMRFNKQDSIKAEKLEKTYSIPKGKIFAPLTWDIERRWKETFLDYDLINNISLNRILGVTDENSIEAHIGEEDLKSVWLDSKYWELNSNPNINLIVVPEKEQLSIVVLEIKGHGLGDAKLELNSGDDDLTEAIRRNYGEDFTVSPQEGKLIVALVLWEESDKLKFNSAIYSWEIVLEKIANPGEWRRPNKKFDDLVQIGYKCSKIGKKSEWYSNPLRNNLK